METRNILNYLGQVVGQLSLPEGTSEATWAERLAPYAIPPITLEQAIANKIAELELDTKTFIASNISQESQMAYSMLMMMAHIDNMTNRFNYIKQLWDWTQAVMSYNIGAIIAVSQLTTHEELAAYPVDTAGNSPAFPDVNMFTAIQITD